MPFETIHLCSRRWHLDKITAEAILLKRYLLSRKGCPESCLLFGHPSSLFNMKNVKGGFET